MICLIAAISHNLTIAVLIGVWPIPGEMPSLFAPEKYVDESGVKHC